MKIVFAYFIKSISRKIVVLRKGIIFFYNYNQFQTALFLPASTHFHHSSRWSLELYPTPIEVMFCHCFQSEQGFIHRNYVCMPTSIRMQIHTPERSLLYFLRAQSSFLPILISTIKLLVRQGDQAKTFQRKVLVFLSSTLTAQLGPNSVSHWEIPKKKMCES